MLGHEPARPAAVREPALGIFTGVPGSLDDPIQRYVFDDYQAPHRTTSSLTDVSPPIDRGSLPRMCAARSLEWRSLARMSDAFRARQGRSPAGHRQFRAKIRS